jgi:hypothetical protein
MTENFDPYKILGVDENAEISEIKTAFRKKAKETHPDLHGGNPEYTKAFHEVAEAYAILSDATKRNRYDTARTTAQANSNTSNSDYDTSDDWDDIYTNADMDAEDIEAAIHEAINELHRETEPYKEEASRAAKSGLTWFIAGLGVSLVSIFIGAGVLMIPAIILGLFQWIRGIHRRNKINRIIADAEAEIWQQYEEQKPQSHKDTSNQQSRYCWNCGEQIDEDRYCMHCGADQTLAFVRN